jgi:hypothetical protein
MNRRTHKSSKHGHAKLRAQERFGISLTKERINSIIKQITSGEAPLIDMDEVNDRGTYLCNLNKETVRVVFHHRDKTIITIMHQLEQW